MRLDLSIATIRSYRADGRLPVPNVTIGRSPGSGHEPTAVFSLRRWSSQSGDGGSDQSIPASVRDALGVS